MKKFLTVLIVLAALLMLAGCTDKTEEIEETALQLNFKDSGGAVTTLKGDIDFIELILNEYKFDFDSIIPSVKSESPDSSRIVDRDTNLYVKLTGNDVTGLEGRSSITVTGIPALAYKAVKTCVYYKNGSKEPYTYNAEFAIKEGKTTIIDVNFVLD